jgi:hypothetical protein
MPGLIRVRYIVQNEFRIFVIPCLARRQPFWIGDCDRRDSIKKMLCFVFDIALDFRFDVLQASFSGLMMANRLFITPFSDLGQKHLRFYL